MRDLAALREETGTWDRLSADLGDALAMLDLAEEAGDEELQAEAAEQVQALTKHYNELEFRLAMGRWAV